MQPRARMGEGCVAAATPHPFEIAGAPLCPLPQGARAREASAAHFGETKPIRHFGETNPMGVLAKRSQAFIWGRPRESKGPPVVMGPDSPPAFAGVGRDDDCLARAEHQPADVRSRDWGNFHCFGLILTMEIATPTCSASEAHVSSHMSLTMCHHPSS
jgi:hypothetical protein